jgi:tRNA(Ile)-lysidine synthase
MRAAGATTPDPHEWGPSPVWPQGRRIFVLRPLLGVTRAALRAWLAARGETWIEDPANADLRYARSRARAARPTPAALEPQAPLALAAAATERLGVITLPREALRQALADEARRFTALAAVCAGGGERLPAGARVALLAGALRGDGGLIATLAGARVQADADAVAFMREPGEAARGGLAALTASAGPLVWDGRFEITAAAGEEVRRLGGLMARLDHPERLRDLPPPARASLPALLAPDGAVRLARSESLVGERLRAAAGLVPREPPSLP